MMLEQASKCCLGHGTMKASSRVFGVLAEKCKSSQMENERMRMFSVLGGCVSRFRNAEKLILYDCLRSTNEMLNLFYLNQLKMPYC